MPAMNISLSMTVLISWSLTPDVISKRWGTCGTVQNDKINSNRELLTLFGALFDRIRKVQKSKELENASYEHFTVNHSPNFMAPDTGCRSQMVGPLWGGAKWQNEL
ncbi:hypothetical protein TNCT_131601 [Trichonephila clavata]|uniref:Secreted protein n=1 Tax=Trichonephila clavata TaxID=2740835 RepID=A0A8X6HEI9_TRICU|nr:hypothetical protein TNCT_131601 [Trichonephila clavata]